MSEHYNTLAGAELLGGLAYEHSLPEDGISAAALHEPSRTRRGAGDWHAVQVSRVLARLGV
jgi:hypothetical protein